MPQAEAPLHYENEFLKGVKDCLPTVLGYLSIGLAAGIVEKTAGMSMLEIILISVFIYAGSAQFIVAAMLAVGAPVSSIVAMIFIVNSRHFLLSASLAPHFSHFSTQKNIFSGFLLTDETFAVASSHLARNKFVTYSWMTGLNTTAYLNWILANIIGAFLGNWIGNPEAFGLDFALCGMFIGLLVLQMIERSKFRVDIIVALSAVCITIGTSFFLKNSINVLVATIVAATIGMVMKKWN